MSTTSCSSTAPATTSSQLALFGDYTTHRTRGWSGGHFLLESHLDDVADIVLDWRAMF